MKLNEDCCRDILNFLVETLTISINNEDAIYDSTNSFRIIEAFSAQYDKADIIYSINMLYQCGYISGKNLDKQKAPLVKQEIDNVTYLGQKFYLSIQPEPIWNKTKSVINKIGVHSLEFIESVAHDVAVESAKQAVSVMLSQQSTQ